jgi:hypothetical protein
MSAREMIFYIQNCHLNLSKARVPIIQKRILILQAKFVCYLAFDFLIWKPVRQVHR